jgi:enolase-phosphatase E1
MLQNTGLTTPRVVLLDIEGTTLPVAFVHKVLFPYARKHLPALLAQHDNPVVAQALAQTAELAPGVPAAEQLERWMDTDAKVAPLKSLQGYAGNRATAGRTGGRPLPRCCADPKGMESGRADAGRVFLRLSEAAQKLIYGYTEQGDVTPLFSRVF